MNETRNGCQRLGHSIHIFDEYDEKMYIQQIIEAISKYNKLQYEALCKNEDFSELKPNYLLFRNIGLFKFIKNIETALKYSFSNAIELYTEKIFNNELYFKNKRLEIDDFYTFLKMLDNKLNEYINNLE